MTRKTLLRIDIIFIRFQDVNLINHLHVTDERLENIRDETTKDTALQKLMLLITNGWPKYINNVSDEVKIYNKFKQDLSIWINFLSRPNFNVVQNNVG